MADISRSNDYLRIVVTSVANTGSANFTAKLYSVRSLKNVSGTLKLGGGTTSISYGQCAANTLVGTRSISGISYDQGGGTYTSVTCNFTGTVSYEDEEETHSGVNADIANFYPSATNPVQTAITTNVNSQTLGSAISITTSGGTSNSNITYKVGSNTGTIASNVGNTTTSWTPALATFAPYSTTSASMTCVITWNGVSKSVTLNVPNNSSTKPSCSVAMSVDTPSGWSTYVQTVGKAKATVTASGKYSATIRSYSISMNGETLTTNPAVSGYLSNSGSNTCTVTVTDSRGFTNTASATFTVTAYTAPRLSGVSIYRSDSSGNAASGGAYLTYKFTPTISSTGNTNQNAKKYRLGYRTQGSSTWNYWDAEANLSSYTNAVQQIRGGNLSATTIYEAYVYIKDSFSTVSSDTGTIPTEAVIMDFNSAGTGGGIGMYTQAASYLDVAWKIRARDGINIPWTGSGVTSTTYLAVFDSNKNIVPMNKDYISGGGGGSNIRVTTINSNNTKTIGTSYVYSGISVTIPANSYYTFRYALWKEDNNSPNPSGIIISSSSSSLSVWNVQQEKLSGTAGYQLEDVYSDYTESSSVTWYLWIKASGSSANLGFRIKGWYMQESS